MEKNIQTGKNISKEINPDISNLMVSVDRVFVLSKIKSYKAASPDEILLTVDY